MDSDSVAHDVRDWAVSLGENPLMKIALCGYDGEHDMPETWAVQRWDAGVGYGGLAKTENRSNNGRRETIWYSPACRKPAQMDLFTAGGVQEQ
jgi:hypothetical protein